MGVTKDDRNELIRRVEDMGSNIQSEENRENIEGVLEDIENIMRYRGEIELKSLDSTKKGITTTTKDKNGRYRPKILYDKSISRESNDRFRNIVLHEIIHGIQREELFKSIEAGEITFTPDKNDAITFLSEGQAVALAGSNGDFYNDASEVYQEVYGKVDQGASYEEAIRDVDREKYMAIVDLEWSYGSYKYCLAVDKDKIEGMNKDDIYKKFVDHGRWSEAEEYDFREIELGEYAHEMGELFKRTHNLVSEAYERGFMDGENTVVEGLELGLLNSWLPGRQRFVA
ncbi:MAG: hypothetical protein SVV03_01820 [Candidatus Nanohaloarchaea archaeon]|nr:hypothetical protein [Candidatus Nanohaloarchaea archaeon]